MPFISQSQNPLHNFQNNSQLLENVLLWWELKKREKIFRSHSLTCSRVSLLKYAWEKVLWVRERKGWCTCRREYVSLHRHGKINRTRFIYSSHRRLHTHRTEKCLKIEVYVYVFIFRAENWIINKFLLADYRTGKLICRWMEQ